MYLQNLHLQKFRNYQEQKVIFENPKTILVGNNAQGKSNLLEAVEFLSTLKSHRTTKDRDLIFNNQDFAKITASIQRQTGQIDLSVTLRNQGRRSVFINDNSPPRHLDFLSILNVVEFSSLDLNLVRGSPEERRYWIDHLVIQLEPVYANILSQYQKVLRQRNALLRREENWGRMVEKTGESSAHHPTPDPTEIGIWDAQLVSLGTRVIRRRDRILKRLIPLAQMWHSAISGSQEKLEISYAPNVSVTDIESPLPIDKVQTAFFQKIQEKIVAEHYQKTTLAGPHRDDILFTINQTPARQYASQGQQRTLVLALKLAELQLIEEVVGEPPLLLLDDVLAELDPPRQNQLLEGIQDRFQTLITTTHLNAFDHQWLENTQILTVDRGAILGF